jgi:glutamate racemase
MLENHADCLVLGCTHYPYLIPQIREIVGDKIQIIDSGEAVAKQTKTILEKHQLLNNNLKKGTHQFYVNKDKKVLETLISRDNDLITIDEMDF